LGIPIQTVLLTAPYLVDTQVYLDSLESSATIFNTVPVINIVEPIMINLDEVVRYSTYKDIWVQDQVYLLETLKPVSNIL
jgi:hypothetical protein